MTTVSADPVRAAIHLLRAAGYTVQEVGMRRLPALPYTLVKPAGGTAYEDRIPLGIYALDMLTYGDTPASARRLAYEVYDLLQVVDGQSIPSGGRLIDAWCTVMPNQAYDDDEDNYYYFQTWEFQMAKTTGV